MMTEQLALDLDVEHAVPYVDPVVIEAKIRRVQVAIVEMNLTELSELYGDLQHGGSGRQRGRSVIAGLRWLCRNDGRHHKKRAIAAVRAEIAERTRGGAT